MIYPAEFEEITGFARIREMWMACCRYDSSKQAAAESAMYNRADDIETKYDECDEWSMLASLQPAVQDIAAEADISPLLARLNIENYYFDEDELHIVAGVLLSSDNLLKQIVKEAGKYPRLTALTFSGEGRLKALKLISTAIDAKGKMLPFASALYGKLNSEAEKLSREARQVTLGIFRTWKNAGFTADTEITVREERLVIPVLAEYKRKVQGFVKDISATGKVLFIEPLESLELNNRLTEIHADIRRERERILRHITKELAAYKTDLDGAMKMLAAIDLVKARYDLSKKLHANRPLIVSGQRVALKQAVNPILWLKNKSLNKETVSMDLELDKENRIMVISGPNAGGKSISLKTAVLLQYMAQCGLFITALPESEIGLFKTIAIELGDGQSIDDGLSTFSAHLQHLKKMVTVASPSVFFAVDELGDGTDPRFGGPIAQAMLEDMLQSGAMGIVTTHYSQLKEWASEAKGVVNASMAFDMRELKPLYKLIPGKPGSSFALELMRKTGFAESLIERVRSLSGEASGRTEDLLMDLSARQLELTEALEENKLKKEQLDQLLNEYHTLKDKIQSRKKDILDGARKSAADLVKEANKQIELTIRTIREHGAEPVKTKKVRQNLEKFAEKKIHSQKPMREEPKVAAAPVAPVVYTPGMTIRNLLNGATGEILEVRKDKILAAFGLLKMWVTRDEIEPVSQTQARKTARGTSGFNWVQKQAEFRTVKDLRGSTAEVAVNEVQKWLDEAYALGQRQLKIIHGRGEGSLRRAVHAYLKSLSFVKNWKTEKEDQGGDGCTLVELL